MFLNDADRLAFIKGLGGQLVRHQGGEFWAIFESAYQSVGDGMVESSGPALEARTSDVSSLPKETAIAVGGIDYRIKRLEPDAGSGMTVLLLKI